MTASSTGASTRGRHMSRRAFLQSSVILLGGTMVACTPTPPAAPAQSKTAAQPAGQPASGAQAAPPAAPKLASVQSLTIGLVSEARAIDPIENDNASQFTYNQMFDRLISVDASFKPIPHVAESWSAAPDGKTYTFKLRSGITFHDGSPLTAEDVKYSLDRILDPKNASSKRPDISMIETIEVPDPSTVKMTLSTPYAPFLQAIYATAHIVPKAVVEKVGREAFGRNPVGSGPFKFDQWKTNESVSFVRNESYWLKKPTLERVVIKTIPDDAVAASNLLAGDVDLITTVSAATYAQVEANSDFRLLNIPSANYSYVGFGSLGVTPPFTDKRLRQAVYASVDAEALASVLLPRPELGVRAYATIPKSYWPGEDYDGLTALAQKKDPEKAKALFAELLKDGTLKADQPIRIVTSQETWRRRIAETVAASIKDVGQNLQLDVMEYTAFVNRMNAIPTSKEPVIYVSATTPFAADPDPSLYFLLEPTSGHGKWLLLPKDSEVIKQVYAQRTTLDVAERDKLCNAIARTVMGDVYHIPLAFVNVNMAMHKKVQGFQPTPRWDLQLVSSANNVSISG